MWVVVGLAAQAGTAAEPSNRIDPAPPTQKQQMANLGSVTKGGARSPLPSDGILRVSGLRFGNPRLAQNEFLLSRAGMYAPPHVKARRPLRPHLDCG
jgi:hypothetical protein